MFRRFIDWIQRTVLRQRLTLKVDTDSEVALGKTSFIRIEAVNNNTVPELAYLFCQVIYPWTGRDEAQENVNLFNDDIAVGRRFGPHKGSACIVVSHTWLKKGQCFVDVELSDDLGDDQVRIPVMVR